MILTLLASSALAFDLLPSLTAALPATPQGVTLVERGPARALVLGAADSTWAVDLTSGSPTRLLAEGAVAVAGWDPDGDGLDDVLLCQPGGLALLPWSAGGPGAPALVLEVPCDGLSPFALEGRHGFAVASGNLHLVEDDGGALLAPVDTRLDAPPPVLLAEGAGGLGLGALGGELLVAVGWSGSTQHAASGPVGGLAAPASGLAWTLPGTLEVERADGARLAVEGAPGAVAAGVFSLDGEEALAVARPEDGLVDVLAADGALLARARAPLGTAHLLARDLDLDGCDDLVAVSDAEVAVLRTVCLPAGGGAALEVGGVPDEGNALTLAVDEDGSLPDGTWTWTFKTGPVADCGVADDVASCALHDDGEIVVWAEKRDAGGLFLGEVAALLDVANVAPIFSVCPTSEYAWAGVNASAGVDLWYEVVDVAADPLTWRTTSMSSACVGDPSWEDGWLHVECPVGEWYLEVEVDDGDGARTPCATTLLVEGQQDSGYPYDTAWWWDTGYWDTWGDYEDDSPDLSCCLTTFGVVLAGILGVPFLRRR